MDNPSFTIPMFANFVTMNAALHIKGKGRRESRTIQRLNSWQGSIVIPGPCILEISFPLYYYF